MTNLIISLGISLALAYGIRWLHPASFQADSLVWTACLLVVLIVIRIMKHSRNLPL